MKCEKCGKKIKTKSEGCQECAFNEKQELTDDDQLIYTLLDSGEENKTTPKELPEDRKIKQPSKLKELVITSIKVILSLNILLFLVLLFIPWFSLGGAVTYEGFVQIPRFIATEEFNALEKSEYETFEGDYVNLSPIRLIGYVFRHFGEYQINVDQQGVEKVSILSLVHMVCIMLFAVMIIMDTIAIIFLLAFERLKAISYVKFVAILNILVVAFNYCFLKLTYINMFALKAVNQIKIIDPINAVKMTSKGIAVNRSFYPYTISFNTIFKYAIILLTVWLFISAVLTEIKRKWDYEEKEIDTKKE